MRILLAEDDRIISQGLIAALRKAGYGVDHVNNCLLYTSDAADE